MFNEYQLLPGQTSLLIRQGLLTMLAYWVCSLLLLGWMYYGEPLAFQLAPYRCIMLPVFIALAGTVAGAGLVASARAFRMYSTDEGLRMDRHTRSVNLRYGDITKIEILPKGHLLVYTSASTDTPSMIISNTITNRDKLDAILQQYRPYEPATRLPLAYNLYYRLAMTLIFMVTIGLHLVTFDTNVRLFAGAAFLIFCAYSFFISWKFRKVAKNHASQIILAVLCALVLFRIITSLLPAHLLEN